MTPILLITSDFVVFSSESYFARFSQAWDDFNENRRFPPHVQAVAQNVRNPN